MKSPRSTTLVRALQLIRALEAQQWTLTELAVRFGVHARTIRRDLYAIEAAGYPICHDRTEDGGRWWMLRRSA